MLILFAELDPINACTESGLAGMVVIFCIGLIFAPWNSPLPEHIQKQRRRGR